MSGSAPEGSARTADAIVVAAGRSERMGGIDKILAPVAGRPLLAWTLDGLAAVPGIGRIVVVTAGERVDELRSMPWLPPAVVAVVPGGDRRQASVAAGFAAIEALDPLADDRVVLVHDGARPVIDVAVVEAVIAAAVEHGAAVPILPIAETVKRVDGDLVGATVDRDGLGVAQTPQGVRRSLLRQAYERFPPAGAPTFTDEAALLEACRIPVHVVPGDPNNLKVTRPSDLRRAEAALADTAPRWGGGRADGARVSRVGIGQDHHPFGPGSPLALGGVIIDGAPRLHGHSDGDVAVHAVCDALLGAAALGDLGRLFPAGPATPEGIASVELLDEVLRQVTAAGWQVGNVDLTIVAARPRLGDHLDRMRDALAARLGVAPGSVNVKASSGNLLGDEGAGRSISATAVALLEAAS